MSTKHYPTYSQSIGLIGIMFLMALISSLIFLPFSLAEGIMPSMVYTLTLSLTIVAAFIIRNNWALRLKGVHLVVVLFSALTIIFMHIILEPIQNLLPVPEFLNKLFESVNEYKTLYFFLIVIIGPILEEIIFRGIILDGLLKNYSPLKAIGTSAFLFALIHGNLAQGIGAFLIGLFFGWIYWKSESIIPCIVLHIFNNALGFTTFLLMDTEKYNYNLRELINEDAAYWFIYFASFPIIAASLFALQKRYSSSTVDSGINNQKKV